MDDVRIRAFFAVALPAAAQAAAAALARPVRDGPDGDGVRWVREESLHVTLRFLGDVDAPAVPGILEQVAHHTRGLAPFTLRLHELIAFPSPRRPRVVALSVHPAEPLAALAAAVERGVVAAGCPPEARRFRPHLTLGRVRRGARPRLDLGSAGDTVTAPDTAVREAFPVTEAVLYRSELRRGGSRYTPLGSAPLDAREPRNREAADGATDITPEPSN